MKQILIPVLFVLAAGALMQTRNLDAVSDTVGFFQLFLGWKVWALIGGALACVWYFTRVTYAKIQANDKIGALLENEARQVRVTDSYIQQEEKAIANTPFPDKMRTKHVLVPEGEDGVDYKIVHYRGRDRVVWFNTANPNLTQAQAEFSRWWINNKGW